MKKLEGFFGVVVYSMEDNECLNGLWTNSKLDGQIMNEIAKKKKGEKSGIDGEYNVTYIEFDDKIYNGELTIVKQKSYYLFEWSFRQLKSKEINFCFTGKGFKIGSQIIVTYWRK